MKKLSVYICLVLLALLVTSCSELVTPVAYTRYETTGTQYAYYSADMVGVQLAVYKDEEEFNAEFPISDIEFSFFRCLGADTLDDEKKYTLVDLSDGITHTTVYINKDYYSHSKSIFLNGQACEPDKKEEFEFFWALTFETLPLVRTNLHGRINQEAVNVLQYK